MKKNILTIATGKKVYIDMAVNLARSFYLHNKNDQISFHIVTDFPDLIDKDVLVYTTLIVIEPNALGDGFTPKLHLDQVAPDGKTLFIDS